ncbi:Protein transport protein sec24 [Rhynchospora pubera]|uniref:Protein transport protein sec24 n=1 Tax=Rhynchospora pubera TaxID=906938 RepID=A0AAV8GZU8_9POAL|nr:Protein transport protein sec24 [Rhynchospora pubera]
MASLQPRPPPNYIPNPNQTPNLAADSFQNLQISGPGSAPPPPTATSGPISRAVQPPPGPVPRGPFASNGPPMAPPSGPPGVTPSMIRAPSAQSVPAPFPGSPPSNAPYTVPPPGRGQPVGAPYMTNPNLNPVSQPLQVGPPASAAQPNPMMGLSASQPNSMNQNPLGSMGPRPFPGQPSSQPYPGPPALASQPVRGPPQSFPGQTFVGQPPMGQPPMGQPPMGQPQMGQPQMGLHSMGPPSMAPPSMGAPPMGSVAPPFGGSAWQGQQRQGGMLAPVRMAPAGMGQQPMVSTPGAVMGYSPHAGAQVSTPSKIDPNQIPRPVPSSNSSLVYFETRQGSVVSPPPPATSDFIVRDAGNCSPRLMRCTMNQIPCNGEILTQSCMPLALMVQPFALPHPSEEPIQLVDFGEMGPVRCIRCKAYINPFMRFIDQGRRFVCNLCGFGNDTPRDYICNLGPDMRRRDADERPELCRGTVEFVATKEFMVREPMPAVYFFLVDVSMNAVGTGATAAACSAISQAISDIPEGPRTMVGIATFDSTIHFYSLKRSQQQPVMLIVPDAEDVYTPLQTDLIVPLGECREALEQLLESIPSMYQTNKIADSAFGAAIKAGFLALKPTGGKLLVFQSVLPSVGIGSLSSREAEGRINISNADKEPHKLLQPADKTLKTMAVEFAEYQVCVDVFLITQTYVDIASISVVPSTTGGQIYYYYPFSAVSDPAKLYNDLRWNLSRPQGFEAVMRVRCSQGIQVQEYSGNFCKRVPTDIDLPAIDSDKTIMVTFKHDDKFQEGAECGFQCAILYTTVHGQRRIRVMNLSLPCTTVLGNLFRSADLDSQFSCFLKQAANGIPTTPLTQVREQIVNHCINILGSYRKFCATISSSGQLILPEALKLLPLYTLALIKSVGLRNDGRLDDRSYWASHVASISASLAVPLVYPRLISIHDLPSKEEGDSVLPAPVALSSEYLSDEGVFLLENGEDALIYVGGMVNPEILQKLFGSPSLEGLPSQLVLQQFGNDLSTKLNEVVNEIRRQRCSYLRLRLCKKGEPSGMLFHSYMVEDKAPGSLSYVEFLVHVHRQIQIQTKSN